MSIKQRDPQAFRQLIGYDIPTSQIIKYGTAALREASGGKGPFAGIPPGGTYLEGMLFKELGSGDAGENNRIGKALYGLYANNQTNPETGKPATLDEVKRAAFNQQHAADVPNGDKLYPKGTLWDAATQASAIKRSAPEFLTWLGARGITLVDKIDQEVAQARKEWAALPWGGGDSGVLKADLNAFAAKYPWYSALTLSNKDSQDRNALFAGDVLSRIPPGSRTAAYDTAGVKELVNGFYAAKGPLAKSDYLNNLPADQQQKFMQFITATDKQYASPTQAQQASFAAGTKFWDSYNQMDPLARQMLRALPEAQKLNLDSLLNKDSRASYPVSSFDQLAQLAADFSARLTSNKSYQAYQQEFSQHGFSDKTLALESGYFAAGAQGSAERRQYLTANPDLKSYFAWRANFMAQHPDLALASQNKGGLPATTAVASGGATTKGAPTAGLSQASAAAYKDFYAARDARYPNVDIKVLSEQYAALSPGATRTQFLNANPQLKDYFQWHTDYLNKTPAFAAASAEAKHLYQPAATSDPSVIRAAAALAPMARELGSYFSLRAGGGGGSYGGGGRGGGASLSRRGTALLNTVARTYTPQLNTTQLLSALEPFYKLENKGAGGTGGGGGAPFLRNVRYIKPYSRGR
ncbi:MAG TPA: hypothetical protein VGR03_07035, partial [Candidatus Acidoferrum sp.]|nr:hypothetical protein [Candidatus Acidoferrum sp.]